MSNQPEIPNLPQEPVEPPFKDQSTSWPEHSAESLDFDLTFPQYVAAVFKSTFSMLRSILIILPVAVVVILVALALMGPAVGNVFSNIVNSL
jgi:hypothetical protein